MSREFINPQYLPDWSRSFTQVVVATGPCKTVYVSGQVSVDERQNLIGEGDLAVQAMRAFQNLETALAAAGARADDVVKLNIYVREYKTEDAELIGNALRSVFHHENLSASTWIGVQALAKEKFLIEIDAIAVIETK